MKHEIRVGIRSIAAAFLGVTVVVLAVSPVEAGGDVEISCNSPGLIVPPDAPIALTTTATGAETLQISGFDCFAFTRNGRRIDKTESCIVSISGNTVTIWDSGGVGTVITWAAVATDASGNQENAECDVEGVRPN